VRVTSPPSPTGSAAQNFFWLIRSTPADDYAFFAFADQDDIWYTDKLQRGCAALVNTDAGGYSCAATAFWSDGHSKMLLQSNKVTTSDFLFEGAGQGCTYVIAARFYSILRDLLLRPSVDTSLLHYHDWAIYSLSRLWNINWVFDERPMVKYRQHNTNDTGARASLAGINKRIALIRQGWYAGQLRAIANFCIVAAPMDPIVTEWYALLKGTKGLKRNLKIFFFTLKGGRRRRTDKVILLVAALAGWI
jgi:rhamnosyltransferase